jgi:hypothetical protein
MIPFRTLAGGIGEAVVGFGEPVLRCTASTVIILANSIGATLSLAVLGFKIRDLNL